MALLVEQWSTTPGLNSDPPPNGAPEGTMKVEELNDTMRVMMAAQRETYDGEITVLGNMPGGATLENPATLPGSAWVGPRGHIDGFAIKYVDNDLLTFDGGEAQDLARTVIFGTENAIQKSLALVWTEGQGQGGRPAAITRAAGWIHAFRLYDPVNNKHDAGFDTSLSAAALLADPAVIAAGYTKARRVASINDADGATIRPFIQTGDYFSWDPPFQTHADVGQDNTSVLRTMLTPFGLHCLAIIGVAYNNTTINATLEVIDGRTAGTYTGFGQLKDRTATGANELSYAHVMTNDQSQIYTASGTPGGTVSLQTVGYIDFRGKDGLQ